MRHSRVHFHNRTTNIHLPVLETARFWDWDIGQWFTPPKSKDIWTAATKGSTGGWAKPFAKPAALLPAAAALAAIPVTGGLSGAFLPQLAALGATGGLIGGIQGATTGIWGKPGASSALKGGAMGALQGAGVSGLGQTVGGLTGAGSTAAASGANNAAYLSSTGYNPAMYGMGGTSGTGLYGAGLAGGAAGGTAGALGVSGGLAGMGTGASYAGLNSLATGFGNEAAKTGLSSLFSGMNPYQVGAGLGISALGSMGSKTPQMELSPMYGEATSRLLGGQGISELGSLGREKLMGNLNQGFESSPDAYYEASTRRLNESYDKAEKDYAAQYKGLRPGANVENDSAYREGINKLRQDRARETSAIAADLDYRREGEYLTRQAQSIQQALGVDEQTMQDYMAIAQMDTERLAMNTGISYGEAQQFKDIFGQLGGAFMQRGLGLDSNSSLQRLIALSGR